MNCYFCQQTGDLIVRIMQDMPVKIVNVYDNKGIISNVFSTDIHPMRSALYHIKLSIDNNRSYILVEDSNKLKHLASEISVDKLNELIKIRRLNESTLLGKSLKENANKMYVSVAASLLEQFDAIFSILR